MGLMDWDMQESAFAVNWLKFNSTNNVDQAPIKCPKKSAYEDSQALFEVLVGDASFELATPAV